MSDPDTTIDPDPDTDTDGDGDGGAVTGIVEPNDVVPDDDTGPQRLTADVATVDRDDDGEILPEETTVEFGGTAYVATVIPMATGEWKKHQRAGADFEQMNLQAIRTMFEEYVDEPDVEAIEDIRFGIAVQLIQAVIESSGLVGGGELEERLEERVAEAQDSGN